MNDQDTLLHTIRQLFTLAEHETANEHEAAVALEKAQALLLKHNLTRGAVDTQDTAHAPEGIGKVEVHEDAGYSWRRSLLNIIAKNNLCTVIGQPDRKIANLFGSQSNVRSVLEMYYWILAQLPRLASLAYKDYEGYENKRTFNAGFYRGATNTISQRLGKPMDAFRAGNGRSLVLVNDARLAAAVKSVFPYTVRSRSRTTIGDGYYHGQQAGHEVTFGRSPGLQGPVKALGSGH